MAEEVVKPAETTKATETTTPAKETPKPTEETKAAPAPEKKEGEAAAKTPETKESKTEETPAAKPTEEVKYDLKLPKGSKVDQSEVERITSFAKEQGLTPKAAQALLDTEHSRVEGQYKAQSEGGAEWKKRVDGYESTIKADKEIGGEAFKENAELAKRVIDRFGSDGLKKDLQATGFGSHPELFRMMVKVGKAMGDASLISGDGKSSGGKRSVESVLYDKTPT